MGFEFSIVILGLLLLIYGVGLPRNSIPSLEADSGQES